MSRTDKTDPWPVRAIKDPDRLVREVHCHEKGQCDLPELAIDTIGWTGGRADGGRRCYWEYTGQFLYGKDSGCGCPMCTAHSERREERRRGRHEARQSTHDLVREANALPHLGANPFLPGVEEFTEEEHQTIWGLDLTDAESDLVVEHQVP